MVDNFLTRLDVAELTDVGLRRQRNEDTSRVLVSPNRALFMVVDGMGGLGGGDVASQYAVDEIFDHYFAESTLEQETAARLRAALQSASNYVSEQAPRLGLARIGATAAGVSLNTAGEVTVFNVGDCRVYRIRGERIERVSRDQSVMERQIESGMSTEEAAKETRNSMVTGFLGQPIPLSPEVFQDQAEKNDVYIVCSDGLWSVVDSAEIYKAVQGNPAKVAVKELIKLALKRGGPDNVTAVVVRLGRAPGRIRSVLMFVAIMLIFAALLALGIIVLIPPNL